MNRRTLPSVFAVFAVFMTAFGVGTPSSYAAGIDPEVVAQSIAEDGYYIDSGAQYLQTDAAQDQLRSQLERSKSPVFVAVIPAGNSLSPVQVYHLAKRKGTYAVLTGGSLRAASNTLSTARVNSAVSQAVRSHRGDPGAAVVDFVRLTNGTSKPATTTKRRTATPTPTTAPPTASSAEPSASAAPSAAAGEDKGGGGNGPLLGLVGALGVLLAAGVGYLVYRRGRGQGQGPKKSPV
jgi:hypothetical protein